ncbi:MAG TPA: type II 3-dehydroquinate dehydratase [Bacteroidia bacterium]|jgi:3-dehydroquinate dehydratase-2|nr:type II 3-dehydroquinate dehydratase [Bacteroidia bacterium]
MKILIINGPNLNLLGTREPTVYGNQTFEEYLTELKAKFPTVQFDYFQSNVEGELINALHKADKNVDGIILNAGAYTHTSIAIADAVAGISVPVVEVHISNIFAREDYRHVSYLGKHCKGSVSGFGLMSYDLALQYFISKLRS